MIIIFSYADLSQLLEDPHVLAPFDLVLLVAPPYLNLDISLHSKSCMDRSIPLFYIHSTGFYSQFSVQLPHDFPVVDTHPDPASTQDLRLLQPWPELQDFTESKTKDLESLSDHDHGHIPYLLLLLCFLDDWKRSHNGRTPSNYSEKKEFKAYVEGKARTNNSEGGEENFDEAAAAILKSLNPPSLPNGLRTIFADLDCKELNEDVSDSRVLRYELLM